MSLTKCPGCGAPHQTRTKDLIDVFRCGTEANEYITGTLLRSSDCHARELAAVRAELDIRTQSHQVAVDCCTRYAARIEEYRQQVEHLTADSDRLTARLAECERDHRAMQALREHAVEFVGFNWQTGSKAMQWTAYGPSAPTAVAADPADAVLAASERGAGE